MKIISYCFIVFLFGLYLLCASVPCCLSALYYKKSLGSVTTPVIAAAAATKGLANSVRLPGP